MLKCKLFRRFCIGSEACAAEWDEGESIAVHVYSNVTAAGDEIGYLYQNRMLKGGQTFTAFAEDMTNSYRRCLPTSRPFMSHTTFIAWWLSWASSHKIDFRLPCPVCKHNPKMLACDGTQVGICLKKANFPPIEKVTDSTPIPTPHKRMDRCFLPYVPNTADVNIRKARTQLREVSKACAPSKAVEGVFANQEEKKDFLALMPERCRAEIRKCVDGEMDCLTKPFGTLLKFLSSTVPLYSIIPPKYAQDIRILINNINIRNDLAVQCAIQRTIQEMNSYAPELAQYIHLLIIFYDAAPESSCDFLDHLINRVASMEIVPPEGAVEIPGTYNPAMHGRAYYFRPSGLQIRRPRPFTIDKEKVLDARPVDEQCQKNYLKVSGSGMTFLFLWFCPLHHHCYGFHMVNGGEGRKDPLFSLYSHLEHCPDVIFYDNACQLQEYALNRESGYFQNCQMYHDIFHGYSHKCPEVYKSNRLVGFEKANSEICEQFNSFVQSLKKSSGQMSQSTFVFCLQYFCHVWNLEKKKRLDRQMLVALNVSN